MEALKRRTPAPVAAGNGGKGKASGQRTSNSSSPADVLLARLDRLKETGPGRWLACCPAHDDRSPSLSVRETDDGTLLVKCFAGCGAADVVASVGLELHDLFPYRPDHHYSPVRKGQRWIPRDVLKCVAEEAFVCALAAEDVLAGKPLNDTDRDRLHLACGRLNAAAQEVRDDD